MMLIILKLSFPNLWKKVYVNDHLPAWASRKVNTFEESGCRKRNIWKKVQWVPFTKDQKWTRSMLVSFIHMIPPNPSSHPERWIIQISKKGEYLLMSTMSKWFSLAWHMVTFCSDNFRRIIILNSSFLIIMLNNSYQIQSNFYMPGSSLGI